MSNKSSYEELEKKVNRLEKENKVLQKFCYALREIHNISEELIRGWNFFGELHEDFPLIFWQRISASEFSVRAKTCLGNASIRTIGELCQWSEQDISKIRGLGLNTLEEIKTILLNYGYHLGMKFPGDFYKK